jgi:Ras-related protein Rab-2A
MDSLPNEELDPTKLNNIKYEIISSTSKSAPSISQDYLFKLIIIGNSGVGKSCLMHRVTTNEFSEDHEVTVGVEFGSLLLKMNQEGMDPSVFKLQIWDTAGQESFQSITKIFYRGAHAVLLTYSVASMQSFQNLAHWCNEVRTQSEPDAIVILVGNQADRTGEREVSREAGEKFSRDNNIQFFIETSAKTDMNVTETFIMAAKMLYKKHQNKIRKAKENLIAKARGNKLRRQQ